MCATCYQSTVLIAPYDYEIFNHAYYLVYDY